MELAPHAGPQRAVLRYQLGLVVPEPEACELRVAGTLARWREGEGMLWDDTFEHSAANRGTRPRVVLWLDHGEHALCRVSPYRFQPPWGR